MVPVNICIPIQMGIFLQSMEILERMERQKNNKTMDNKRPIRQIYSCQQELEHLLLINMYFILIIP